MEKQHQEHAEMDSKQARMTCYFMKHTRLVCEDCTTSVLSIHEALKTTKNSGMPSQTNHQYTVRISQHKLNKHAQT